MKWIGGASNQDLAAIEDLAGIYALAGVHCLDVAADAAVVAAARRGVAWARQQAAAGAGAGAAWHDPWLMVSLSDGADPHFRKAGFDPALCPRDCPRPCERVCPALAIPPLPSPRVPGVAMPADGVLPARCYGCGRCLPACPLGRIEEREHVLPPEAVAPLLAELRPDAIELHTRLGRGAAFAQRLEQVCASGVPLQRLAVSCGLESAAGERLGDPAGSLAASPEALAAELQQRYRQLQRAGLRPLWQLDGRPMSGDVGRGTAHAAVRLLERLAPLVPPGPLQLAGGTNDHTLVRVERLEAATAAAVAGVAVGGVARSLLQPLLLQAHSRQQRLLEAADLWPAGLDLARALVQPWLRRPRRGR